MTDVRRDAAETSESMPVSGTPVSGAGPSQRPNRLSESSSPYLLQHQYNPVDWHEWGPSAFDAARERGVPIFLSVGYSTCYWCHVMERESFESVATAALLNESFVCVKVDREERPDVDEIYMNAVQLMNQSGGWPMSVWLTPPGSRSGDDPGLEPFYAGTYFPPEPMHGRPSFSHVIRALSEAWASKRDDVLSQAGNLASAIRANLASVDEAVRVDEREIGGAIGHLLRLFDSERGGFGGAPKFPQPTYLEFLFEVIDGVDDPAARSTVERALRLTLDRMALGGMMDQVGGGFHRYSVDAEWLVPHFEKMLYDNAQLASVYARAYGRSRDPFDAEVCRRTLDYVLREMTSDRGGFYSAQDAEVDAREGLNYLWTADSMREALGETPEDAELAIKVYGLDAGTNFTDPHHPDEPASNVLFLSKRLEGLASEHGLTADELGGKVESINARLLEIRDRRKQPSLDDKIITSWNGLMIAGLADGAIALDEPAYLDAAKRAADFLLDVMRDESTGDLRRTWRTGRTSGDAVLEDYAFLIHGLLAIHRAEASMGGGLGASAGSRYFAAGEELAARAERLFADEHGVMRDTTAGRRDLIARTHSTYDGAVPAAASVMLHNTIELFQITHDSGHLDSATRQLAALSAEIQRSPVATVNSTRALYRLMALDPAIIGSLPERTEAGEGESASASDDAVRVFSSTDRVAVGRDQPAEVRLRIEIDPGYHITAHEPGVEGMSGLSISVHEGTGVEVDVDYPTGVALNVGGLGSESPLLVHEGGVEFAIRLKRNNDQWSGRPLVVVDYQACTATMCEKPRRVELDVAVDPA